MIAIYKATRDGDEIIGGAARLSRAIRFSTSYIRHLAVNGRRTSDGWKIDLYRVEPKQRWVPVTDADSLPKKSIPCLVACNQWGGEIVRKATYLYSEKIFYENGHDITEYVTHWMPCPEPPKTDAISEIKEIHERFERLLREVVKGAEE